MKKISFVVGKDYQNNKIFDLKNRDLNRDNCLYPFYLLKAAFANKGYSLDTADLVKPEEATFTIYNEMPKPFPAKIPENSFLLLFESEIIRKDNWDLTKHAHFKKIFTWHDNLIDNKKYFKFNFPNEIKTTKPGIRTKLITLISGNKTNSHPLELYSKRLQIIKWLELNHPDDFDYYGVGWDYKIPLRWQRLFHRLKLGNFIPKNNSRSYRGKVQEKFKTLRDYTFAICYENAKDIDGYITEKIFDCLFAGTIPIYWGPGNISKYIPEDCFINRVQFSTDEELYLYLKNMPTNEVIQYQNNILTYLTSERVKPFSNEFFAQNILKVILNE